MVCGATDIGRSRSLRRRSESDVRRFRRNPVEARRSSAFGDTTSPRKGVGSPLARNRVDHGRGASLSTDCPWSRVVPLRAQRAARMLPPAAPPAPPAADDTGASHTDNITNRATPTIVGAPAPTERHPHRRRGRERHRHGTPDGTSIALTALADGRTRSPRRANPLSGAPSPASPALTSRDNGRTGGAQRTEDGSAVPARSMRSLSGTAERGPHRVASPTATRS
jgi:hypothetical protein